MFVHQQYSNFKKDMSPKKYIKKHPVVAVVCFTGLIWAMGLLLLDAPAPYIWEKHFAKIDELENRFAPVAAFFSGLSAIATAYLIGLQMTQNDRQERDAVRALSENQIFQMFSLRAEIIKSLAYTSMKDKYVGKELFEFGGFNLQVQHPQG